MLRKTVVAIGVLALFAGISYAGYRGLTPIRTASYKASGRIGSRQERVFHEYLREGTYLISLYGSSGRVWRSHEIGGFWDFLLFGRGRGRDDHGLRAREADEDEVGARGYTSDGKLRYGARSIDRDFDDDIEVERHYSGEGKLDAVRPKGLPLGRDGDVGARGLGRDGRGGRDYGWRHDLPSRHRGGPDVDLYIFNHYGNLVAVSDSYESSESVLLRVHSYRDRWLEFVVHSARGSGSFYLTVVRI